MKFILTISWFLLSVFLSGQNLSQFPVDHYCSTAKLYESIYGKGKDIVQSPLLQYYDVRFYFLDLNVSDTTTFVSGSVTMNAVVKASQLDTLALELIEELPIDSVIFNGQQQSLIRSNDEVFIPLTVPVDSGSMFVSKIYYHGTPPESGFFSGVSTSYDSTWNKHVTWTLSEPFNAKQWWPTKQVLSDKADSVWVFLTTDVGKMAGSEGLLTHIVALPGNKVRYEWKSRYPIDYYLISFSVADYQDYSIFAKPTELNGDSILIQNFIYNSPACLAQNKIGLDETAEMIELFSDLYSLYPFSQEKYGHCQADLSGGMEHQTMTTLNSFSFLLVAHELGHMWFGDNVTCATWSDIWINEGFATYTDYLAHEKLADPQWAPIWLQQAITYVTSEPDGSVYVPPDQVTYENEYRIFDSRLSYYKGAMLLHMIRYELQDDDLFFQVYKNFQAKFKDSVATGMDFMDELNETTGQDFGQFFDQWYFGEGYPIFNIYWEQSGTSISITSKESVSAPDVTPFFTMHFPVDLVFDDGSDTTLRIFQDQETETVDFLTTKQLDTMLIDPHNWVVKKIAGLNGINPPDASQLIEVSPNPVGEKLSIRTTYLHPYSVSLMDLSGHIVKNIIAEQGDACIIVSNLNNGIYLLIIDNQKEKFTQKIIKY